MRDFSHYAASVRGRYKIGIGIITKNRKDQLEKTLDSVDYTTTDVKNKTIYVSDDGSTDDTAMFLDTICIPHDSTPAGGVAGSKNRALKYLLNKGCEYIFLLEDDCEPVKSGWIWPYIYIMQNTSEKHINYTPAKLCSYETRSEQKVLGLTIQYQTGLTGLMMTFTREAVETVGAFDERFNPYGFEHVDWTNRAIRAGLTAGYSHIAEMDDAFIWHSEYPSVLSEEEKARVINRGGEYFKENQAAGIVYIPFAVK